MSQLLSKQEYYNSLAKKPMGSEVIFFNDKKEILIVKPNYKEVWLMPGGSVEAGESPSECAIRETKEEIDLDVTELKLLCMDYGKTEEGDYLKFIFFGGTLDKEQISKIKLRESELTEFKFVSLENLANYFSDNKMKRMPECLKAIEDNNIKYLEHGTKIKHKFMNENKETKTFEEIDAKLQEDLKNITHDIEEIESHMQMGQELLEKQLEAGADQEVIEKYRKGLDELQKGLEMFLGIKDEIQQTITRLHDTKAQADEFIK